MARPKKNTGTVEYTPPAEVLASKGGNGHETLSEEGYQKFVDELKSKGAIADGNEIASDGIMLLGQTAERRAAAVHYVAAVESELVYEKDHLRARILDQMARTVFPSPQHLTAFVALLDYSAEFGGEKPIKEIDEWCLQYVVGLPSINGRSRSELVDTVTMVNQRFSHNYYDGKQKPKGGGADRRIS